VNKINQDNKNFYLDKLGKGIKAAFYIVLLVIIYEFHIERRLDFLSFLAVF